MTVAHDVLDAQGRRGRVFVSTRADLRAEVVEAATSGFMDEEDARREALLRDLIAKSVVVAWAHPGVDPSDVIHLYLAPLAGGEHLFACAVVSRARLDQMLREAPVVIEGFTLQVVEAGHLSRGTLGAAAEAWAERNFPGVRAPAFLVQEWRPPLAIPENAGRAAVPAAQNEPCWFEPDHELLKIGARRMPRELHR